MGNLGEWQWGHSPPLCWHFPWDTNIYRIFWIKRSAVVRSWNCQFYLLNPKNIEKSQKPVNINSFLRFQEIWWPTWETERSGLYLDNPGKKQIVWIMKCKLKEGKRHLGSLKLASLKCAFLGRTLLPRQSSLGLNFGFLFFSAFSHKSLSGLYSACVTNACVRDMEFTKVVVVQSY